MQMERDRRLRENRERGCDIILLHWQTRKGEKLRC